MRNILFAVLVLCAASAAVAEEEGGGGRTRSTGPGLAGGEVGSVVQVANLIYSGVKSSKCFSDHFLVRADAESAVSTSRRFHTVKLESADMFDVPFVIMTGEGNFTLSDAERSNMKRYCGAGGFLLASAGCSSAAWDQAFRREVAAVWPDVPLEEIPMTHPLFHTVYDIDSLQTKHGEPHALEGLSVDGQLVLVYSRDGLNDTAHTSGCCCCGGNEIANAEQINVNILAYALTF